MARVLIVDDDRSIRTVLRGLLEKAGLDTVTADGVDAALAEIRESETDLIITDLRMPGKSGMDLLALNRDIKPEVPVIMVTAYGNIEAAVAAMKQGAYDFVTKPFDEDELLAVVNKALSESRKNRELVPAYFERETPSLPGIIGSSPLILENLEIIRKAAPTDSTVLITGETGVGKELLARAVHQGSPRREHTFVKVNCAAIPDALLEGDLFGYEKGAFTGAVTSKPGRLEIARKGTVFLDEIGEMPVHLQAKLLGVLQDRAFERLGGVSTIRVDVRFVAATNVDLKAAVQSGTFRADLFYRLNVVPVHVPPLRQRMEDLLPLAEHFLRKYSSKFQKDVDRILPGVMAAFGAYGWPGNIRELEHVIERMVLMSEGRELGLEHVPPEIGGPFASVPEGAALKERVSAVSRITEKEMILDALQKTGQNRTRAARLLGISRRALQQKIKEYRL